MAGSKLPGYFLRMLSALCSSFIFYWALFLVRGFVAQYFGVVIVIESWLILTMSFFFFFVIIQAIFYGQHTGNFLPGVEVLMAMIEGVRAVFGPREKRMNRVISMFLHILVIIPIAVGAFFGLLFAMWMASYDVGLLGQMYTNGGYAFTALFFVGAVVSSIYLVAPLILRYKEPKERRVGGETAAANGNNGANGSKSGRRWTTSPQLTLSFSATAVYSVLLLFTGGGGLLFFDTLYLGILQETLMCDGFAPRLTTTEPGVVHARCFNNLGASMQHDFRTCFDDVMGNCPTWNWARSWRYAETDDTDACVLAGHCYRKCPSQCNVKPFPGDPECFSCSLSCPSNCTIPDADGIFASFQTWLASWFWCWPVNADFDAVKCMEREDFSDVWMNVSWVSIPTATCGQVDVDNSWPCWYDRGTVGVRCLMPDTKKLENITATEVEERVTQYCFDQAVQKNRYTLGLRGRLLQVASFSYATFVVPNNRVHAGAVDRDDLRRFDTRLLLSTLGEHPWLFGSDGGFFPLMAATAVLFALVWYAIVFLSIANRPVMQESTS